MRELEILRATLPRENGAILVIGRRDGAGPLPLGAIASAAVTARPSAKKAASALSGMFAWRDAPHHTAVEQIRPMPS